MSDPGREFDVVVFGATGFTGRLVADYLATRLAGTKTRWALAGRNTEKLAEVRRSVASREPSAADVPLLHASVDEPRTLLELAARSSVVLSTVGPFARYGMPVVDACVEAGTDYVDITGEPDFVGATIEKHHHRAHERGLRIVSCCGFDSIPHDLGVLFTMGQLPKGEAARVRGFVRVRGGFSGGTWHSFINALGDARRTAKASRALSVAGRDELRAAGRTVKGDKQGVHYERALHAWAVPLPTIDPQIVLRSARLRADYGPEFTYGHYARIKRTATLVGGGVALTGIFALAQLEPTRKLLLKVRDPGEGPSESERARNWFKVTFVGEAGGTRVRTQVSGGDPGYSETSKMVAESALCLAQDRDRLPPHAGVVTPSAAMGEALRERLVSAGMRFEVLPSAD